MFILFPLFSCPRPSSPDIGYVFCPRFPCENLNASWNSEECSDLSLWKGRGIFYDAKTLNKHNKCNKKRSIYTFKDSSTLKSITLKLQEK